MTFEITHKVAGARARAGTIITPHGTIPTPCFVPVGTKATVKSITPEMLAELGASVCLGNTYHLYLQPGDDIVREAGGMGAFMHWSGPTITDSGGFQVFSLGAAYGKGISKVLHPTDPSLQIPERSSADDGVPRLATIGNDGVSFRSHIDGSLHYITPERSMEIQHNLGADIIFAFDECTSPLEDDAYQRQALERTHAWGMRSLVHHEKLQKESKHQNAPVKPSASPSFLFGIIQGGRSEELRKLSATVTADMRTDSGKSFDGFGIGGSFDKDDLHSAVRWVNEILPEDKPRHLLGIGEPEDIFLGVENGVDMFDCVAPTRNARTGTLYTKAGKINISNTKFQKDFTPIETGCACYTCTHYTRAYVAHLFRAHEMLAGTLATIHNLYFITHLVADIRTAIMEGKFYEFRDGFMEVYKR